MFRWASRTWRGVSPHERQALLTGRGSPVRPGIMESVITGTDPGSMLRVYRKQIPAGEGVTLRCWTDHIRRHWSNHEEMMKWSKRERVFGLEIPEAYGGLGYSPFFHVRFLRRLASIDITDCP